LLVWCGGKGVRCRACSGVAPRLTESDSVCTGMGANPGKLSTGNIFEEAGLVYFGK